MANLMEIFYGARLFVSTVWELQEMRFSAIFDDLRYIVISVFVVATSCCIEARERRRRRSSRSRIRR